MELSLAVCFFQSALSDKESPQFNSEATYRAHLIVEGGEQNLGVEFIEIQEEETDDGTLHILGRTISPDVDYSALNRGVEFFIMKGPRMVGRGSVRDVYI